jgi:DNA-binding transcriptional ArsR family regulator
MKNGSKQLDSILKALASGHRRAIIYSLSLHPSSISILAKELKLSLPAIHKHVKALQTAQLLRRKKSGRSNFLALNREALTVLRDWILQYQTYWGSDKESLENYVKWIEDSSKKH